MKTKRNLKGEFISVAVVLQLVFFPFLAQAWPGGGFSEAYIKSLQEKGTSEKKAGKFEAGESDTSDKKASDHGAWDEITAIAVGGAAGAAIGWAIGSGVDNNPDPVNPLPQGFSVPDNYNGNGDTSGSQVESAVVFGVIGAALGLVMEWLWDEIFGDDDDDCDCATGYTCNTDGLCVPEDEDDDDDREEETEMAFDSAEGEIGGGWGYGYTDDGEPINDVFDCTNASYLSESAEFDCIDSMRAKNVANWNRARSLMEQRYDDGMSGSGGGQSGTEDPDHPCYGMSEQECEEFKQAEALRNGIQPVGSYEGPDEAEDCPPENIVASTATVCTRYRDITDAVRCLENTQIRTACGVTTLRNNHNRTLFFQSDIHCVFTATGTTITCGPAWESFHTEAPRHNWLSNLCTAQGDGRQQAILGANQNLPLGWEIIETRGEGESIYWVRLRGLEYYQDCTVDQTTQVLSCGATECGWPADADEEGNGACGASMRNSIDGSHFVEFDIDPTLCPNVDEVTAGTGSEPSTGIEGGSVSPE